QVEQGNRGDARSEREHSRGASRKPHERARRAQDGRACAVRRQEGARPAGMSLGLTVAGCGLRIGRPGLCLAALAILLGTPLTPSAQQAPSVHLVDVTKQAGITFTHNNAAFGKKYLPETLGSGAAFLDYDNDGWQDLLLVNGTNWPGQPHATSRLSLYRNKGNGTFENFTAAAGLNIDLYGMGVAVADYDNDGFQDILITAVGQNHLF